MNDPWMKFYPSDWLTGTHMLTGSERGIYITIIALIYDEGGPVKFDARRLARSCGVSNSAFRRAMETLTEDGKLVILDGYVSNSRAEMELRDRTLRREKAALGGKKAQQNQRRRHKQERSKSENSSSINQKSEYPQTPADAGAAIDGMKEGAERDFLREAVADGACPNAIRSWARGGFQIVETGGRTVIIVDGMHDRFVSAFERTYARLGWLCWSRSYADTRGSLDLKAVHDGRACA